MNAGTFDPRITYTSGIWIVLFQFLDTCAARIKPCMDTGCSPSCNSIAFDFAHLYSPRSRWWIEIEIVSNNSARASIKFRSVAAQYEPKAEDESRLDLVTVPLSAPVHAVKRTFLFQSHFPVLESSAG